MTGKEFSIREIFNGHYSVPIYQRAYAWSEKEIETLVDDIYDYYALGNQQNYYIGSLVVHQGEDEYENVIDGQQRLTTLSLLICYLKNESAYQELVNEITVNLDFESRKRSTDIFKYLKKNYEKVMDEKNELVDGYRILKKKLSHEKYNEGYFRYLIDFVILIKNELPKSTDLNHYFEIMNNRGEQLEKHEIVKAYLMGKLQVSDEIGRKMIAEVWNACQRLDKYVQIGFNPTIRGAIFSAKWDDFVPKNYAEMKSIFQEASNSESKSVGTLTIEEIIQSSSKGEESGENKQKADDDTGRYHSIINFPNFLLHVLKLFKGDPFDWRNESEGISLDDKKLISQFKAIIQTDKDVEDFIYLLLKTRYIFDNYVIKTDNLNDATDDDSNWSLHKPYMLQNNNNKKLSPINTFNNDDTQEIVIKIQSMFQVTDPRQIYKSFLFGILKILNTWIDSKDENQLVEQLIQFAKERFRALTLKDSVFNEGVNTPNYIFNFLDFMLWYQQKIEGKNHGVKVNEFEFKYRNSVEHFYPQNPNQAENHARLEDKYLNSFGNLCIMSRNQNSLRSNLMPLAKIKEFGSQSQSLKFEIMASITNKSGVWDATKIMEHGEEMKGLLTEFVSL